MEEDKKEPTYNSDQKDENEIIKFLTITNPYKWFTSTQIANLLQISERQARRKLDTLSSFYQNKIKMRQSHAGQRNYRVFEYMGINVEDNKLIESYFERAQRIMKFKDIHAELALSLIVLEKLDQLNENLRKVNNNGKLGK